MRRSTHDIGPAGVAADLTLAGAFIPIGDLKSALTPRPSGVVVATIEIVVAA